ncbi:hypothetical protein ACVC7V_00690 [Hydrogenophaga sp. A37]|uniref:hypothetical protein n=1 Tax=Hydrogenophaga sp. A37 TaxID=1945864 RepID=UPI00098469A3|nr:hypothetical protein [Hydrogenophaga sp. A37]OOG88222.1 hypothetical protein B0E41_02845 [Hydrogenophaga sp. A37]
MSNNNCKLHQEPPEGQLGIELGTAQEPGTTEQPVAGVFRLHGNQVLDAEHRIHADQVLADGTWVHGIAVPGRDDYYEAGWISDGSGGWVDRTRVEYDGLDGNDAVVGYRYDDRLRGGDGDDDAARVRFGIWVNTWLVAVPLVARKVRAPANSAYWRQAA